MSFLVLDANTAVSIRLIKLLADSGCPVHGVADIEAANAYLDRADVSAILSPELISCKAITALHPQFPVVFFSEEPIGANELHQCLSHGLADCLALPLSAQEVIASLEDCVKRKTAQDSVSENFWRSAHNALEVDLQAGRYIQTSLLPPTPQRFAHICLEHRLEPSLLLSGDFADYFALADGVCACYLADVSGHGSSAAFVTVLLKHFSAQLARRADEGQRLQPGEVLSWMNNELIALDIDKHVAMFFACVDSAAGTLTYANAAQFPPAFLALGDSVTMLEQKAKPLGLFPNVKYRCVEKPFPPGARLGVFTDGVLDLVAGETLLEKEKRLADIVRSAEDMAGIWSQLDLDQLGQDDVSCLRVANNA
jgi:serine phosphatase RsbU (regulator of sigma subunit)